MSLKEAAQLILDRNQPRNWGATEAKKESRADGAEVAIVFTPDPAVYMTTPAAGLQPLSPAAEAVAKEGVAEDLGAAAAIAREAEDLKEFFEERSAILEHDAGLPRPEAELEAARITAALARNRGYLWASLRAALAGYPVLLAQLPATAGPVDSLPMGVAKVHVGKGRRVVRQGTFNGAPEVKA